MNLRSLMATSVAFGLLAAASAANAAVTVTTTEADDLFGSTLAAHGQYMLDDFDAINSAQTSFVGNIIEYPSEFEDPISSSAPPPYSGGITVGGAAGPVDPTNYASVQGAQSSTYTMLGGQTLRSFSFYMGSPDTYNRMTFNFLGGGSQTLSGTEIWDGPNFNGDRTKGFRVYYDFGGDRVTSIKFESDQNAFEFDGLAGAVPEPATWTMMIMGFGAAGAMLRSRRRAVAA